MNNNNFDIGCQEAEKWVEEYEACDITIESARIVIERAETRKKELRNGQRILSIINKIGITQSEFADKVGFHATLLSQWKRKKQVPVKRMYEIRDCLRQLGAVEQVAE